MVRTLLRWMKPLRATILHPQWLAPSLHGRVRLLDGIRPGDRILDVGCADGWPRARLPSGVQYVGLDYPATTGWYGTRPDVFADAARIPFVDQAFDAVILFDVLEHLEHPERAIAEIFRVLKPGGALLMNTPFMYPLHDEPRDFRRWTSHGHQLLAREAGFIVERIHPVGSPVESAFLAVNIALAKMAINGLRLRRPAALLLVVLPLLVVFNNVIAWLLAKLEPADGMMPTSYHGVLRRPLPAGQ